VSSHESWQGHRFSDVDLDMLDLGDLVGQTCLLNVQHSDEVDGRVYANVASVLPPQRGMPKRMATHNDPVAFSFDHPEARHLYAALPQWLRDKIARSPEYKEMISGVRLPKAETWSLPTAAAASSNGESLPDDPLPW
jgi:hypothetical protein